MRTHLQGGRAAVDDHRFSRRTEPRSGQTNGRLLARVQTQIFMKGNARQALAIRGRGAACRQFGPAPDPLNQALDRHAFQISADGGRGGVEALV